MDTKYLWATFAAFAPISLALYTPVLAQGFGGVSGSGGFFGGGGPPEGPITPIRSPKPAPIAPIRIGDDTPSLLPDVNFGAPEPKPPPPIFVIPPAQPISPVVVKQPPRPVPQKRGLNEHRGQGDIVTSNAIQMIVKTEGQKGDGGNPYAKMPDGSIKAVWGTAAEVVACNSALVRLRVSGRIAGFRDPINSDQQEEEQNFLTTCLGAPDPRVTSRLGRLVLDDAPLCTVFFLTPTRALTARHCLYERQRSGGVLTLEPLAPSMKKLAVELGPVSDPNSIPVKAVFVPSEQGVIRHSLAATSDYSLPSLAMQTQDIEQRDYIAIEVEKPITTDELTPVRWASPRFGDKVFLPAFHEPTRIQDQPGDTGFRQQVAGYCQIVQPLVERCITHACSTTPGSSGAPMLVERDVGGSAELHFIGLHTSGKREDTGCTGNPQTDRILNYGVRLNHEELQMLH